MSVQLWIGHIPAFIAMLKKESFPIVGRIMKLRVILVKYLDNVGVRSSPQPTVLMYRNTAFLYLIGAICIENAKIYTC
jgi:hypothetical protein